MYATMGVGTHKKKCKKVILALIRWLHHIYTEEHIIMPNYGTIVVVLKILT